MRTSKKSLKARPSTDSDLRQSLLYREAEELFRAVYKPGSGRPTNAAELAADSTSTRVAFTGTLLEDLESSPRTRLYTADLATGKLQMVSFGPHSDMTPKFSSDGRWLAFRSDRTSPGDFQTYLLDLQSGLTSPAPRVEGWVENLEFSPDGRRLLVLVAGHGADVAGVQGAKTSKRGDLDERAGWLPAVETGDETFRRRSAWLIDTRTLTTRRASPAWLNVWEVCWCGNDSIAAVVTSGASEDDWYHAHLVRIKLSTGKTTVLHQPKVQLGGLSSSRNGLRLAIIEAVCSDRGLCAGDLLVIDPHRGKIEPIKSGMDVTAAAWRDDRQLLITGIRDLQTQVAEVDAVGGKVLDLWCSETLCSQSPFYPVAVPCGARHFAMMAHGFREPAHMLYGGKGRLRNIMNLGHEGTDRIAKRLFPVRPYLWKAADGQKIQGWLMRPAGKEPVPLVMEVHGGPIWRSSPLFLGRAAYYTMLAERGYAFFWPNPRGSSGRGQQFARAVVGDMGGGDAQDCLSGLNQLEADGIADPKRIGVMGSSYGGFMSDWLVTQDQRFAAAIAIAPISDWLSQQFTSNIGYFVESYGLRGESTDAIGNYYARSPVMHAHRVKTPTLNICGALDRCSPPGQAQEFYSALRHNNVAAALVTYPKEGHGVRSFPAIIDFSARVVDWFSRYIDDGTKAMRRK